MEKHSPEGSLSRWEPYFNPDDIAIAENICDLRKQSHSFNLWKKDIDKELVDRLKQHHGDVDRAMLTEELTGRRIRFEQELQGAQTMTERLCKFISPEYLPYLQSFDLGESMRPSSVEDLERVESEYHEMRQYLIDQDIITGELSRRDSDRMIHLDKMHEEDGAYLGTRNRSLFNFSALSATPEQNVSVVVRKQTSFLIDGHTWQERLGEELNTSVRLSLKTIEEIEAAIDTHDESIFPIRTLFFVKVEGTHRV